MRLIVISVLYDINMGQLYLYILILIANTHSQTLQGELWRGWTFIQSIG